MTSWKPWFARIHSTVSERRSSPGSRARRARASRAKRFSATSSSADRPRSSSRPRRRCTGSRARRAAGTPPTSLARERPHAEAAVRLERDEPERREPPQRLADGRAADRVLRRDLLLAQHRARRELAGDDRLLERERELVGLRAGASTAPVYEAADPGRSRRRARRAPRARRRRRSRAGRRPAARTRGRRAASPTRIVTAAAMFTSPIAAPGASGLTRAASVNDEANGIPAARPTTAAATTATPRLEPNASSAVPAPPARKLARSRPVRP